MAAFIKNIAIEDATGKQTNHEIALNHKIAIGEYMFDGTADINVPDTALGGNRELTLAEYQALSDEEKMNGLTYYITDVEGNMPVVVLTKEEYDALGDEKFSDGNIYLISDDVGDWTATGVAYNNTNSGLAATNVGDAIDELAQGVGSADIAEKDSSGNIITETYETKTDANSKLTEAKTYADTVGNNVKNDLLNGAGGAYDTLKELGDLIDDNTDAIEALEIVAASKQDASTAITTSNIGSQSVSYATTAGGLTGVTTSAEELNFVDGVTSPIQDQIDILNNTAKIKTDFTNITTDFTSGAFSTNLDKYKPGDFILIPYGGVNYVAVLAHYNYFYNPGRNDYANVSQNHWVAIVLGFTHGQMNSTNITTGGFAGSEMYTWLTGDATTTIKAVFGENHLIAHNYLLSIGTYDANSITHGFSWEWKNGIYAMLPSEVQVYGSKAWSDLGWSTGEANRQLDIFREKSFMEVLGRNYGQSNNNFNTKSAWLRDISAYSPGAHFCNAYCMGDAGTDNASYSRGRFPLILLK